MQNWDLDPKTGDYVMEGGAPKETDSLNIPAYIRLKTPRLGWLYAPDTKYGSDFQTIKKRQSVRDASHVETVAANALQPILDDGRAESILVNTEVVTRNAVGLKTEIERADGKLDTLKLDPLGA